MGRVPAQEPVRALIYSPLTLTILLTDLTRLQLGEGLMTLTYVPAVMTRKPRGDGVVESPQVVKMHDRMTGLLILHVLTERKPDVLKRQKNLLSR